MQIDLAAVVFDTLLQSVSSAAALCSERASFVNAPELIPFLFLFFRFVSPFYPVIFSMVNKKEERN